MRIEKEKDPVEGKYCLFYLPQWMIDNLEKLAFSLKVPKSRIVRWGLRTQFRKHDPEELPMPPEKEMPEVSHDIIGPTLLEEEKP